jgi:hypothetical protein
MCQKSVLKVEIKLSSNLQLKRQFTFCSSHHHVYCAMKIIDVNKISNPSLFSSMGGGGNRNTKCLRGKKTKFLFLFFKKRRKKILQATERWIELFKKFLFPTFFSSFATSKTLTWP